MSKSDEYRRLTKLDTTMNDDGTNIQFVFHGENGEPARFHTGVEGLGFLLKMLKDRARAMVVGRLSRASFWPRPMMPRL